MRMRGTLLTAAILVLTKGTSGLADSVLLSRHLAEENDPTCLGGTEENLYYNIDIAVDGIEGGCADPHDLFNIGTIIQQIVEEAEAEIPKYDNEKMETTVCAMPFEGSRRNLRTSNETTRALAKKKGKYTYRGGGRCRRCKKNNSGRRFMQAVTAESICLGAGDATYGAEMAVAGFKAFTSGYTELKEKAVECSNWKTGENIIKWATQGVTECKKAQRIAQKNSNQAVKTCQAALRTAPKNLLASQAQEVAQTSENALKAAENTRKWLLQLQQLLKVDICTQAPEQAPANKLSVEGACAMADTATYGDNMAKTAIKKADDAFLELTAKAMECTDLTQAQRIVIAGKSLLTEARKAQQDTTNRAKQARNHCQQAKGQSGNELIQIAQKADEASKQSFLSAELVRFSYRKLKDNVAHEVCINLVKNRPDTGLAIESSQVESPGETDVEAIEGEDSGGVIDAGTETKEESSFFNWINLLGLALHERLPARLIKEYGTANMTHCDVYGFKISIMTEALEEKNELDKLITEEDCESPNFATR